MSLGIYAHGASAVAQLDDLRAQAACAARLGFSGVTVPEHHAGFQRYVPVPVQVAGWALADSESMWAAPAPILLPLRPARLVVEEVAWLAARFPGRVGLGLAPGWLPVDFEIADADVAARNASFRRELPGAVAALRGAGLGPLAGDPAVAACAEHPVPVLASAAGPLGARRAARAGAGIFLGAFNNRERVASLLAVYGETGGSGPRVLIRRAWLGRLPADTMRRLSEEYERVGASWHSRDGLSEMLVVAEDPTEVADRLAEVVAVTGAEALNLRFTIPDETAEQILAQIERFGEEVLPKLCRRLRP